MAAIFHNTRGYLKSFLSTDGVNKASRNINEKTSPTFVGDVYEQTPHKTRKVRSHRLNPEDQDEEEFESCEAFEVTASPEYMERLHAATVPTPSKDQTFYSEKETDVASSTTTSLTTSLSSSASLDRVGSENALINPSEPEQKILAQRSFSPSITVASSGASELIRLVPTVSEDQSEGELSNQASTEVAVDFCGDEEDSNNWKDKGSTLEEDIHPASVSFLSSDETVLQSGSISTHKEKETGVNSVTRAFEETTKKSLISSSDTSLTIRTEVDAKESVTSDKFDTHTDREIKKPKSRETRLVAAFFGLESTPQKAYPESLDQADLPDRLDFDENQSGRLPEELSNERVTSNPGEQISLQSSGSKDFSTGSYVSATSDTEYHSVENGRSSSKDKNGFLSGLDDTRDTDSLDKAIEAARGVDRAESEAPLPAVITTESPTTVKKAPGTAQQAVVAATEVTSIDIQTVNEKKSGRDHTSGGSPQNDESLESDKPVSEKSAADIDYEASGLAGETSETMQIEFEEEKKDDEVAPRESAMEASKGCSPSRSTMPLLPAHLSVEGRDDDKGESEGFETPIRRKVVKSTPEKIDDAIDRRQAKYLEEGTTPSSRSRPQRVLNMDTGRSPRRNRSKSPAGVQGTPDVQETVRQAPSSGESSANSSRSKAGSSSKQRKKMEIKTPVRERASEAKAPSTSKERTKTPVREKINSPAARTKTPARDRSSDYFGRTKTPARERTKTPIRDRPQMKQRKKPKRLVEYIRRDLWNRRNPQVVLEALESIADAADRPESRGSIARAGGLLGVVRAMEDNVDDAAIQIAACSALERLALDPENELAIAEVGGVDAVLGAMMCHFENAELHEAAWSTMWNLTCLNSAETMTIDTAGGMEAIVSCMKQHLNHAQVQKNACGALTNLCLHSAERLEALADAGGFVAISSALQKHFRNVDVRKQASIALTALLDVHAGEEHEDED